MKKVNLQKLAIFTFAIGLMFTTSACGQRRAEKEYEKALKETTKEYNKAVKQAKKDYERAISQY